MKTFKKILKIVSITIGSLIIVFTLFISGTFYLVATNKICFSVGDEEYEFWGTKEEYIKALKDELGYSDEYIASGLDCAEVVNREGETFIVRLYYGNTDFPTLEDYVEKVLVSEYGYTIKEIF